MKKHVRMSPKRKMEILRAEAARNEETYGEYAVQPTKLSERNGLSAPVLGQFLADHYNPWAENNFGKKLKDGSVIRPIGYLSRSVVGGLDTDGELNSLIDELPDAVSDDIAETIAETDSELPESELTETELAS